MKNSPFSRRSLAFLASCATALAALSVLLHAYGGDSVQLRGRNTGSYSVSALGHAGFYDLLRRLDYPVARSGGNALRVAGDDGVVVIAEPDPDHVSTSDRLALPQAKRLLFVLPKWSGIRDQKHPSWISWAELLPVNAAQRALGWLPAWGSDVLRRDWPPEWAANELGYRPEGSGTVQLIRSVTMRPVVGDADGMLVGEIVADDRKILVLSDPDILSNHGIVGGDNAAFALALIDRLRPQGAGNAKARVVFEESVHGFRHTDGLPFGLLFRFPFVIVTILACCSALLLALAGTSRFGAPLTPKPPLDFGKKGLIDNGARLLDYAGYHAFVLRRYVRMTVRNTAHSLHAPPGLDEYALVAWLDRVGEARGVAVSCRAVLREMAGIGPGDGRSLNRLFETAAEIHRWKGEILNGPAAHWEHR